MNRIDRLFGILLALQHKHRIRAEDLARQFEVSKRTIYRDLSALGQLGVPIVSLPGIGFELVEGYYVPPLMFKEEEALALSLGLRLLTQQAAGSLMDSANSALAKVKIALPERVRMRSEAVSSVIGFITPDQKFNLDDPLLLAVQAAILDRRVIHIQYHSFQSDADTERDVEPYQLFYSDGIWYLEGYCRLRRDTRVFRLSRIEKILSGSETFSEQRTDRSADRETIVIKVRFAKNIERWVRERQHYSYQHEETSLNGVVMVYEVQEFTEITSWILGWGDAAEVISPGELRSRLREIARNLANLLT